MTTMPQTDGAGDKLLHFVQKFMITSEDAQHIVRKYRAKCGTSGDDACIWETKKRVAKLIVKRYCRRTASSGVITSLPSVVPGMGQVISMVGGALSDTAICLKLQADMCSCLAQNYDYTLDQEEMRDLAMLLSAGGAVQKAAKDATINIASKAGVNMIKQYLKGQTLQVMKQMFKRIGITVTQKGFMRAIPFVAPIIGGGVNYGYTKFIGNQSMKWFDIAAEMDRDGS